MRQTVAVYRVDTGESSVSLIDIAALVVGVALCVFLFAALLYPQKL